MQFWRTNEVAALRRLAGSDAVRVAAAIGRSPRAVQDKARSVGAPVPRSPHPRYWPTSTKRRACAMRKNGQSVSSISTALGVPFGTVRRWVYEGIEA